jgi:uncharacterized protein (DUF433 family)
MVAKQLGEAEKMARVPGIYFADGAAGRRAKIGGTGISVWQIIEAYHEWGDDRAVLYDEMDWLMPEQLDAALRYYAALSGEIDDWVRRDQALVPEGARSRSTKFARPDR